MTQRLVTSVFDAGDRGAIGKLIDAHTRAKPDPVAAGFGMGVEACALLCEAVAGDMAEPICRAVLKQFAAQMRAKVVFPEGARS